MAGTRQPTDLVVLKGKKHLTKAEIEARKNAEVTAPNDKVKPPAYLSPELKKKFRKLSKELLERQTEILSTLYGDGMELSDEELESSMTVPEQSGSGENNSPENNSDGSEKSTDNSQNKAPEETSVDE